MPALSRADQIRARRALVGFLMRHAPGSDPKALWSELGYLLNRWAYWRVKDAVYAHRNIDSVIAALRKQPPILHLPKRNAA